MKFPSHVDKTCENPRCKKTFRPRFADVKRGWGRFCSKSCKAAEQERRTGQHTAYLRGLRSDQTEDYGEHPGEWNHGDNRYGA